VLPLLQKTTVFRPLVVLLIAAAGLGGAGLPLYFRVEELNSKYIQEKSKYDLLRANAAIRETLKVYQERMSGKTEFLQWVSDLRELAERNGVAISGISPSLSGNPDKNLQKLSIKATISGRFTDIQRLVGVMQNRREKVHISDIGVNCGALNGCVMTLDMAMLLLVPAEKKKQGSSRAAHAPPEPQKPAAQAPAPDAKSAVVKSTAAVSPPAGPAGSRPARGKAEIARPAPVAAPAAAPGKALPAKFAEDIQPVSEKNPSAGAGSGGGNAVPAKFAADEPAVVRGSAPASGRRVIVDEEGGR